MSAPRTTTQSKIKPLAGISETQQNITTKLFDNGSRKEPSRAPPPQAPPTRHTPPPRSFFEENPSSAWLEYKRWQLLSYGPSQPQPAISITNGFKPNAPAKPPATQTGRIKGEKE
ncbi:hypothetical protein ABVK25_008764 [Lepraria finkii]|uniref:Uncharacterized protein n=1 Tax=Lepraria finkii TaxID=1340010 RepID=A0ABR4B0S8_9LECA